MDTISYDASSEKFNSKNYPADPTGKMQKFAIMKTFCLCLLMVVVTFCMGLAVVTLSPKLKAIKERGHMEAVEDIQHISNLPQSKYKYLNHMQKSKRFVLQGGVVQWARYRADPTHYDTQNERAFGESIHANGARMTASTLEIKPNGCRVPHWHFNANEHGYLIKGKVWIGILDSAPFSVTSYNVSAGQVVFLPRATLHWMKCVGRENCLFILFFTTSDELVTRDVDDVFYATPKDIAARSLKPKGGISFINTFKQPKENQAVNLPPNLNELVRKASYTRSRIFQVSKYFFNMRATKRYRYPGGIIQWARYTKRKTGLPLVERIFAKSLNEHEDTLTLATMRIFRRGMRQPHYHFNAHTMGYVLRGCARVGVDRNATEFTMSSGDVFFVPRGVQHYIMNVGQGELTMVIAFSTHDELQTLDMNVYFQNTPDFILAQLFLKKQDEFHKIPTFRRDQDINLP
ncbi:oxalate decarboxylase OxdC-like [Conger conger]|uniref:oxalate decarboxylase OxdC-like n=1 Tax=Conger conger TaxID=82655 RepID=UPI002A5A9F5F|nr:oxalate decarboxylase OxdC-like [Conger conger]